jgi:Family of unknown function (DUF6065)
MEPTKKPFYAYDIYGTTDMPLTTAPVDRAWMDAADQHFAYRCLPLAIANQSGWLIHNPATFSVWWDGGPQIENLQVHFGSAPSSPWSFSIDSQTVARGTTVADPRITSHFGSGVLTFSIPFVFRTPPGINLWVKGPSNYYKDGVYPLEGIVETDWLPATFTMNWKITRPHHSIRFERGEPICMVVPVPRGLCESLDPIRKPLADEPKLQQEFQEWTASRAQFLINLAKRDPETIKQGWQKDYNKGLTPLGERATEHQTRLHLQEFRQEKDDRITR